MRQTTLLAILWTALLLTACQHRRTTTADGSGLVQLPFRYAENITVEQGDGFRLVRLLNPWQQGQTLHTYVLVDRKDSNRVAQLPEGTVVWVPLHRAVSFNTAHASLVGMLGVTDQLRGVADVKYMQLPEVHRRLADGRLAACGDGMAPDIETLVDIGADGVLLSPFENSGGYGRLETLGIPIIECADYMETSPLGRAEWMRFYGMLFGCEQAAETLFAEVEQHYLETAAAAQQDTACRSLLTEKLTGNTWYVAGGRSTVARLIADAGGRYAWSEDRHSGSLALSFEAVLDQGGDADVWVFNDSRPVPMTYDRLQAEYHGYRMLKAFRQRQVWVVNSMQVPYFEEVSFRPDWLLRDYAILLHPQLAWGEPRYFHRVGE